MSRWRTYLGLALVGLFIFFLAVITIWGSKLPRLSPAVTGYIGAGALLLFLISGVPIAFSLALVGFVGMSYLDGMRSGLYLLGLVPFDVTNSYVLIVIPLFILMGQFAFHSGLSRDLYDAFYKWVGHFPGGLAMATIGACAAFGAVSGSSLATAATMGTVSLPEMKRYKYDDGLACGTCAAGGTLGGFIPPSVAVALFCILTKMSISTMFITCVLPGILNAFLFMAMIYIMCKRNPLLGPRGPKTNFVERIVAFKNTWAVFFLFLLVIGGLYWGVFTPTEAAGIGAFGALLFVLSRKKVTRHNFVGSLLDTGRVSAMVFLIIVGSKIFGYFLTLTGLPSQLAGFITEMQANRYIVWASIIYIYLILGCLMDGLSMMILTIPIVFPIILALDFDPIWFGVQLTILLEAALITPPVAINVFIIKGVAKDVPLPTIIRGIVPFLSVLIGYVVLVTIFPDIVLFVPRALGLK